MNFIQSTDYLIFPNKGKTFLNFIFNNLKKCLIFRQDAVSLLLLIRSVVAMMRLWHLPIM